MLAFHNDPKIKAKYLRRVRAHYKADQIVQNFGYWNPEKSKGCAVGCTLHSDQHSQYPVELGIPEEIAYLEDHFFERLPNKVAKEWPARFLSAIRTGANLTRVYDLWAAWNLIDPEWGVINLVSDEYPTVREVIKQTGEDCLAGKRVSAARAADADRAARAARAACAAYAARAADADRAARAADADRAARAARADRAACAAYAARAARAAGATYAAYAARAAYAADAARAARAARAACAADVAYVADAADAAYAADAARAAYYKRASDKLIELLEVA